MLSQGLRLVGISLCVGTLISAALTACWIPAARAARVDALRALRHD